MCKNEMEGGREQKGIEREDESKRISWNGGSIPCVKVIDFGNAFPSERAEVNHFFFKFDF